MWNYRIIRHVKEEPSGGHYEWFSIHEVYYDKDGKPNGCTVDPVGPTGDTAEEVRRALLMMLSDTGKPVLDYDEDFKSAEEKDEN